MLSLHSALPIYNLGAARLADRFFDETFLEMRAGRVDAFTAPVGKRAASVARAAKTLHEPGGKIATHHVAVATGARPAGDKADGNRLAADRKSTRLNSRH